MDGKVFFILAVIAVDISSGWKTLGEYDVEYQTQDTEGKENDAPETLEVKMSHVSPRKVYQLKTEATEVTQSGPIHINLTQAGVPKDACEVIVYALVRTGHVWGGQGRGDLVVSSNTSNGLIERKLYYYSYNQAAWAYNSENMIIPVTPGMTKCIEAKLVGPEMTGNHYAEVQIVGYARP